jgi:glyoxylase-like metal-dependent hydrolase (beta-lactamase superfamily II)
MGRFEFERYDENRDPSRASIFDDSIRPVTDAGLVDLVDPGHHVCEELSLIATPGHSPGHLGVQIGSQGQEALLAGDVAHHPCQLAHLDWSSTIDFDPAQSARTRHDLFARLAGTPTIILGGHFVGGTIMRDGEAFRLAM